MKTVKAPNLTKLLNTSHNNKWVALSRDHKKVLATGETLATLEQKIETQNAIVMKVLPQHMSYAP